jgi:glycosyltransferase involved in cell wall biosynthesis
VTDVAAAPASRGEREPGSLRVLLVTNMYPTDEQPWFGCFVRDQAEDLDALGVDLHVFSFDGRRDRRNYARAAREVRRLVSAEGFDLVHAHYGLTGAVAAVQRRVPLVTTFHGSDYNGWSPWQRRVSRIVARRSSSIVMSEDGRRALGRPSAAVIPCGVDIELFAPLDRFAARRRLGWTEQRRYVLFPGTRADRRKRADLFDSVLAEIRTEIPAVHDVALEGLSRENAALVMNAADVTVMTSDAEGSPVAVRESLACMTPVVSVDVGDVAEVLAGLPGCSIQPRDPEKLAGAVLDALRGDRHEALRRRAEQTSRRAVAERVLAVYQSVAAARR